MNAQKPTVVLVNPPNGQTVLRDLYSSTISKGLYNWPCVDLLVLSGVLKKKFSVQLLDANTEGLTVEETVRRVKSHHPVGICFAIGASVREEDYALVQALRKALPQVKMAGTGGILYHNPVEELQNHPEFDACILNFTTDDTLRYFLGEENLENMVFRKGDEIVTTPKKFPPHKFAYPVPAHDHLPLERYRLSHGKRSPLTSVLTAFGCPSQCHFCVSGSINYRYRDPDNVLEELETLHRMGVREIFFRDNVFGFHKAQTQLLLQGMIDRKFNFSWVSDTRANLVTEETASLMAASGCHALHIGVESANDQILSDYQKDLTIDTVHDAFRICRKNGIRTIGYFILGLPGETEEDIDRTIDLAIVLDCDYASFNVPIPILGTALREDAIKNQWINPQQDIYDGSSLSVIHAEELTPEILHKARSRAMKRFYLRPRFIYKTLAGLRTFFQVKMLILETLHLARSVGGNS